MIKATPNGKTLSVQVEQGATTYIAAENPILNGVFVGQIPESSIRQSFTVTDCLDGTSADEYLKYDGDHVILTSRVVNGKNEFEGLKIGLTNSESGDRFTVGEYLPHAECIKLRTTKENGIVITTRYSDLANVAKSEETRRAYFEAIRKAVIFE
jgi:hypothetical protein